MPTIDDLKPGLTLPAGRIAIGLGAFAAPSAAGPLLGFSFEDNHAATLYSRAFGIRDAALGIGTLLSRGSAKKLWLTLGLVCDLGDAAAGVLGIQDGGPKRGHILTVAAASGGIGLSIAALIAQKAVEVAAETEAA